ncbi:beta-lactamase-like protein 2 homolog [Eurytemora carolleeae]|uniref:beta-lactamase-like protein 2 homolog n=1 Tax=Eurytemora carolleeae TaxID=1294199 RepID=UPI000C757869|nr:beta-lactamase-like protein 2 homolog [Eurytemora carolleeae]|eukprot:XP_023337448.1 beta-lactamase-like protein 2 homolog [Eurytemora affinis]
MLKSKPRIHKFPRTDGPEPNIGEVQRIEDGSVLEVEGAGQVKLMHTPGHTQDHVVVYLSDLHAYMISLQKILDLSPSQIYPGHGPIIQDPIPKIEFYIKHRTERENQILAALSSQPQPQTPGQLVKIIYKDTPEHLHLAAENNVNHHLSKLLKENKVENKDGLWRTC